MTLTLIPAIKKLKIVTPNPEMNFMIIILKEFSSKLWEVWTMLESRLAFQKSVILNI